MKLTKANIAEAVDNLRESLIESKSVEDPLALLKDSCFIQQLDCFYKAQDILIYMLDPIEADDGTCTTLWEEEFADRDILDLQSFISQIAASATCLSAWDSNYDDWLLKLEVGVKDALSDAMYMPA